MSGNLTEGVPSLEEVIAVTDPGDINRDQHTRLDRFVIQVGNVFAWLFPVLMIAIVVQVVIRKMGNNQAWLDDLQWWLYGVAMMVGFAYAVTTNSHVRVDIFHAGFSREKQAKIELFGLGWLLLPFLAMMGDIFMHYAYASFLVKETSDSPTGLHGIYLLKMFLVLLFVLAILATLSAMWRNLGRITRPSVPTMLIAGLPAFIFAAERIAHYVLWWYVRFTKPDINPRKIGREDLLDNAMWIGFATVGLVMVASLILSRKRANKGS
ncbi:MAG TPA: TRAP transporter small permease subunit [Aliiroseovarius sp.]|nr:TRAP transporter small permease subunit [Aliiroseovarius sp.]